VRGDDEAGVRRRRFELRRADLRERQIAECAAAVPAFETFVRNESLRPCRRIDVLLFKPWDSGEAVPLLAAALCVEEVLGKRLGIALGEAERR
jgi:hypothetical protein